ncbi:hypothetical protein M2451_000685 [Dysgonomonas sp. PFB1-18]|uniref:hypothetical protein n=1 Tax=unclassified Dysgonomonas TaxID=2630389 RepID=UPI002476D3F8|nr:MULTISPECIES: hypothetical protein [unclassified Dysgonomonas]MDL2303073.1 hypothetical protein [Dysgonomonas sp. OttesenSCG-928-D17]MDH6307536.1 hypothetical protein [Dysgonomonas sp. PF1-14]MDH6337454.1 hypothetical protein [Dysgonomonas sp. PF1-16]MDH6379378.1 hypothetical protein [Dysgonomonas sp. PFB1-18]MDH6395984.1 hypothetical protein [Dysgonomonas sp. PF1-23]
MKLRDELEPKIEIAENLFSKIMELISLYDDAYDNSNKEKMQSAIDEMNQLTNKSIVISDLFEYWEGESLEELAFKISLPDPIKVDHISREELLELIRRVQSFEDEGVSDKLMELDVPLSSVLSYSYYIPLLERNFSYSEISGLFDRQFINGEYIEYSTEEIADIILSHKAIQL